MLVDNNPIDVEPMLRAAGFLPPANFSAAFRLAGAGLAVFPCQESGEDVKHPKPGVFWRNQSTTDHSRLEMWSRRWPDAIVGIDLAKSGLIVIDCDRHGGPDGVAAFAEMIAAHVLPDGVPIVETPSGGRHYYFRQPEGEPHGCVKGAIPPGIDVKGHGGYVIAPGCHIEAGRYATAEGAPDLCEAIAAGTIPVAPEWLMDCLRSKRKADDEAGAPHAAPPPASAPASGIDARNRANARAALDREAAAVANAPEGTRNETLNRAAFSLGTLAGNGSLSPGEVAAALSAAGRAAGLSAAEAQRTIASGLPAGMAKPRDPLPEPELVDAGALLKGGKRSAAPHDGGEPLRLFPPLPPAAPYPLEALGVLQPAAEAIARKVQVPGAMAAQSVLAVAALAAQAHCDVFLPYGQKRPLSTFFATIAASGDRKSSGDSEASWPVTKREKVLQEEHREKTTKWKIAMAAWQAERKKIEADKKSGMEAKAAALAMIGAEPEKPLEPFLCMSDMTLDGLTKNWVHAHPSLAIFTAEGGTFTGGHGMSDENRLRTAAALSEVWDGKAIKRIRALDGVTILPGRRLSLHVMIQPDASHNFLANPVLRDQGLLSRILVAAPESMAGGRFYQEPNPADDAAIRAFGARILHLLEAPAPLADGRNELAPRELPMGGEATALWIEFFNHVEARTGQGGQLAGLRDFASKAAEHAARLAGVLTIARDLHAEEIECAEMDAAVALMDWYLGEAERLHGAARLDPRLSRAAGLLEWMQVQQKAQFQFRDILRLGPAGLRTKAALEEAVSTLLDHGWLSEASKRPRSFTLAEEK